MHFVTLCLCLSIYSTVHLVAHGGAGKMDHSVIGALWLELITVQCTKPPEVVTTTAEMLDELGLKEKATQLRGWLVCQSLSGK